MINSIWERVRSDTSLHGFLLFWLIVNVATLLFGRAMQGLIKHRRKNTTKSDEPPQRQRPPSARRKTSER